MATEFIAKSLRDKSFKHVTIDWIHTNDIQMVNDGTGWGPYQSATGSRLQLWRGSGGPIWVAFTEAQFTPSQEFGDWSPTQVGLHVQYKLDPATGSPAADDLRKMGLAEWMRLNNRTSFPLMMERMVDLKAIKLLEAKKISSRKRR